MGTRNLTLVRSKGALKVAQYGQWDGYPEGQGATVAAFVQAYLMHKVTRGEFAKRLTRLKFATDAQLKEIDAAWDAERKAESDAAKAGEYYAKYRAKRFEVYSRDTGATILQKIWDGLETDLLQDESEFLKDTVMCEWAYLVDLDTQLVEVYMASDKPVAKIKFADFTVYAMRGLRKRLVRNHERRMARHKAKGGKVVPLIELQMRALTGGA